MGRGSSPVASSEPSGCAGASFGTSDIEGGAAMVRVSGMGVGPVGATDSTAATGAGVGSVGAVEAAGSASDAARLLR